MDRSQLIELGVAIARAQMGSAGVVGHQRLLAHLGQPERLRAALGPLLEQAREQVARWSAVEALIEDALGRP